MTEITKDNFDFIHWEKDSGGPESFELMIYCESKKDADDKKQQILDNQKGVLFCDNEECDGVLKWSTRFKESQEKLDKIKDLLFHKTTCTNTYVLEELKKILDDNENKK